jgi:hypothetical protein
MQRYSGIFMGRRKKQTSETKSETEGLGDDREPQGLAYLAAEFHKTLNLTKSNMVHHLQESQETNQKGQDEITKTLKKVDGNLRKIDDNLIRGKTLRCMETERLVDPRSEGSHGGGMSHEQMGSKANPRPYLPTFTDEQVQQEQVDDFVEQMAQCTWI